MTLHATVSTGRMLLRTLQPSAISFIICLLIGLVIVVAHTLSLSTSGIAYPTSADDTFMLFYTNHIVRPLASMVSSDVFNMGVTVVAWGALGLFVYAVMAGAAGAWVRWREAESNVSMSREGKAIRHPLEYSAVLRGAWRVFVVAVGVLTFVAMLPLLQWCLLNDLELMRSESIGRAIGMAVLTIAAWAFILHCYLVLLRLFLFRTRVFGELLY